MSDFDEQMARIDGHIAACKAYSALLAEENRQERLRRGDPPPRRETTAELLARVERMRAENDAMEVEQIHYHTP